MMAKFSAAKKYATAGSFRAPNYLEKGGRGMIKTIWKQNSISINIQNEKLLQLITHKHTISAQLIISSFKIL